MTATTDGEALGLVVTTLMRGPVYQSEDERLWHQLVGLRTQVTDYLDVIGLRVDIDESEGYAYLRGLPDDDPREFPRLVRRRTLSYRVSLLLVLLREKLAEADAHGETRLVLTREQIVELARTFLPEASSEARLVDQIDADIRKVAQLGFLRPLENATAFEVRRILKAFVNGEWLASYLQRLTAPASGENEAGQSAIEGASRQAAGDAGLDETEEEA